VKRERGFTLLEMIVSTLIMSIAVVGMMSGLAGATRNAARLRDYERIAQAARLRMNELMVDTTFLPDAPVNGNFDPEKTGGLEAGWQARASNFETSPPPQHPPMPGETVLDRIQLDVWWINGSSRRTFTLETIRRRVVLPPEPAR